MIGAVDIGGTKIAVGLVDDAGRVLSRADCPTDPESGYAAALERTQQMLRALSSTAGVTLTGIGTGSRTGSGPWARVQVERIDK